MALEIFVRTRTWRAAMGMLNPRCSPNTLERCLVLTATHLERDAGATDDARLFFEKLLGVCPTRVLDRACRSLLADGVGGPVDDLAHRVSADFVRTADLSTCDATRLPTLRARRGALMLQGELPPGAAQASPRRQRVRL